jgi:diketogulonate reductase-like aldo/keto reductase
MKSVTLKTGDEIPIIGLGTWQLTGKECVKMVETALEVGYTHIDTAVGYGNHKEVGQGIKNSSIEREDFFLTSKIAREDLRYNDVLATGKEALKDLGVDYLDLLLVHWPNKNIPLEETLKAFAELKEEGLVKNVGVSNFTINHLKDAFELNEELVTVNQVELHPYLYQQDLIEFCQKNKLGVTAYSPLARGRVFKDQTIKQLAGKYDWSPAQLVLRWLIDRGIIVIPKTSSKEHLVDNLKALESSLPTEADEKLAKLNEEGRIIDPSWGEFDY